MQLGKKILDVNSILERLRYVINEVFLSPDNIGNTNQNIEDLIVAIKWEVSIQGCVKANCDGAFDEKTRKVNKVVHWLARIDSKFKGDGS